MKKSPFKRAFYYFLIFLEVFSYSFYIIIDTPTIIPNNVANTNDTLANCKVTKNARINCGTNLFKLEKKSIMNPLPKLCIQRYILLPLLYLFKIKPLLKGGFNNRFPIFNKSFHRVSGISR